MKIHGIAAATALCLIIDVSSAQGVIDYTAARAWRGPDGEAIEAVIVKCDEGNSDFSDTQFAGNWSRALVAGFARGAYHFAHPDTIHAEDAVDEARRFCVRLHKAGFRPGLDFAALDIEEASRISVGHAFTEWVITFCETVDALLGTVCGIYTGGSFFNEHDGVPDQDTIGRLRARWLWLAAYVVDPSRFVPEVFHGQGWTIWQATGDLAPPGSSLLHVAGIGGGHVNVDRSWFVGDGDVLRAWIASLAIEPVADDLTPPPTTERSAEPVQLGDGSGVGHSLGEETRAEAELAAVDFATGAPTKPEAPRSKSGKMAAVVDPSPDATWPSDGSSPSSSEGKPS